jgi:hypothetical protein
MKNKMPRRIGLLFGLLLLAAPQLVFATTAFNSWFPSSQYGSAVFNVQGHDTAAVQAAINLAFVSGGHAGAVRLTCGTYNVGNLTVGSSGGTGTEGLTIEGDGNGPGCVIINFTGASNTALLTIYNSSDTLIRGLGFYGGSVVGSVGIKVLWDGSHTFDSNNSRFRDLYMQAFDTGIQIGDGTDVSVSEQYFDSLEITGSLTAAVSINSGEGQNQFFTNDRFTGGQYGINCIEGTPNVYNTVFAQNSVADIYIGSLVTANTIQGNYTEQSGYFLLTGGPSGVVAPTTVSGNVIAGSGTKSPTVDTLSVSSASRTSGITTFSFSSTSTIVWKGTLVTISGVSDSSFNGDFYVVSTIGTPVSGITVVNAGSDGSSSGGTGAFAYRFAISYHLGGPLTLTGNQFGTRAFPTQLYAGAGSGTNLQVIASGNLWWEASNPYVNSSGDYNFYVANDLAFFGASNTSANLTFTAP